MKWLYIAAGIALFIKMLIMPNPAAEWEEISIVGSIVEDAGVSNAVSGIIFRNRLYDTIFEVVVFTIAILGVKFLLANETPIETVYQFSDRPSIVLARLGATIAAIVSIELAIRGHLINGYPPRLIQLHRSTLFLVNLVRFAESQRDDAL